MRKNKKFWRCLLWLTLGIGLITGDEFGFLNDYWGGMGYGFLGVGIARLFQVVRYQTDAAYRENVNVQNTDERNHFLTGKAWSWAGYLYVLTNGAATIVLRILGYNELSLWAAWNVCIVTVFYWLCYFVLRRKY